jgi:(2Fe-2S) ferredoxin
VVNVPYYQHHLFFCTNMRDNGKQCCAEAGALALREYAKKRLKQLGCHGIHQNRANVAGCLGRCQEGPILVVYPEGVWYTYHSQQDVDEIIDQHILNGKLVERLLLPAS